MIVNCKCYKSNDGFVCANIDVPTAPFTAVLTNVYTNTVLPGPSVFPAGSPGPNFTTNGKYCWTGLLPGTYELVIKDSSTTPCVIKKTILIEQPTPLALDFTVSCRTPEECDSCDPRIANVNAIASGGTPPYVYSLENQPLSYGPVYRSDGAFSRLAADDTNPYTLTVTDANDCTAIETVYIKQPNTITI